MTKMIENKFFEAFKYGGVASKCIDWMRYTHNLPEVKQRGIENRDEASKEKEERYYKETLPNEIVKETEAFKREVLPRMGEMLDEIEDNIRGSKTDTERDFYLYSLFKPFGESGCNIAGIYNPTAETAQMKQSRRHERAKSVARNFISLTIKQEQAGTVEKCTGLFVDVMLDFANRLDALLLVYHIDMMRLQKECGIYLTRHRVMHRVADYIGSVKKTQELIRALSDEPQLQNELARSVFDCAVRKGWMQYNGKGGFIWKGFGRRPSKAQLAYLCAKIYGYIYSVTKGNIGSNVPYEELERLFGVTRLDRAVQQVFEAIRPQLWRKDIDTLLEDCKHL